MDQPRAVAPSFSAQDLCEPAVVLQASGMLAIRLGLTCPDALGHMRRFAAHAEQPLSAVAEAVVTNRSVELRE